MRMIIPDATKLEDQLDGVTDATGTETDQFAYSPYGELLTRTGTNDTAFLWLGGYGVYHDNDTELHLTLYRAYSADMRRFISADPLGIDGGPNRS